MNVLPQLADYIHQGGPVTRLLAVIAAIALAVVAERSKVFYKAAIHVNVFLARLRQALIAKHSITDALGVCAQYGGPVSSIIKAGLLQYGQPRDEVHSVMETKAIYETRRLEKNLLVLSALPAILPTLGLAGTLIEIMATLDTMATQEAFTDPALFAGDLSRALIPFTTGVVASLPILLAHFYFRSRLKSHVEDFIVSRNLLLGIFEEMERADDRPPSLGGA